MLNKPNRLIWIGFFCFFISLQAIAQSTGQLKLSTGVQKFANRDLGFSPLTYEGYRSISQATFSLDRPHKTECYQLGFAYGLLQNRIGNSMNVMSVGFMNQTFYHKNNPAEKRLQWGWSNQNVFNIRRHNGFSNYSLRYDYLSSIGPTARYMMPFQWKRQEFEWTTMTQVQVLGFQLKSGYIGADPEGFSKDNSPLDNFFQGMEPFLLGRDWHLGFSSSLDWDLPSDNSLGIRYQLDMSSLRGRQNVLGLGQSLLLVLTVKLW
ncbi:hypothetical protein SAMN04488057_10685 [Cyclobacterium lianum]|uniref:Outer membrane protein beta-barrel family protein n=1 Tax=Cyclobacterium lianum TaxID=388280 RepID=A0A1M7NUB0_9BACT|nr:hypothetical protein [Cyclobacterium lianum]SHN07742.1 hypothetical protein SAMN04488057_10685 [Cyclobacterium lianum]